MQECFTDVILSSITFSIFLRFNIKKIEKVIFRRFFIELIGLEKSVVIHTVSNEMISEIVVFLNVITNLAVYGETGNRKIY